MAGAQDRLFRSAALERLSSPEGLDTLMEITTVRGWIALAGLGAVVVAALVWGVLGRLPEVVTGQGIMQSQTGVYRIQAAAAGQIESVSVQRGSKVLRDQTIAVVAQPELVTAIGQLETSLAELRANRASTASRLSKDSTIQLAAIGVQQQQAESALVVGQKRLAYLDDRIAKEDTAFKRGLLTRDVWQSTIALRAETRLDMLSDSAKETELRARAGQIQAASQQQLFPVDQSIAQSADRLAELRARLERATHVVSPLAGTVVELLADPGQSITDGAPIATVEASDVAVRVLMFIPLQGKRIKPDMRVQMVPGGVQPEEKGYFLGTVSWVSQAPLSGPALDLYLKNEVLAEQFTRDGGAYLVEVRVTKDPSTVSGFKWTSRAGDSIAVGSGTLLTGKVIVETKRPYQLVVPALKRWLGG